MHEQQRGVVPVGQFDELCRLLCLLAEQHAAGVGQDSHRVPVDPRPAGDQAGTVQRFELVEVTVVDHPGQDLPRVERGLEVLGDDAQQFLGVVTRRGHHRRRRGPGLVPVEPAHDATGDAGGVDLVHRQVVGQAGPSGVHVRATEGLLVGDLSGGGLDQRGAGQEHLGALGDHHHVVAHPRYVGAAGGGVAVDHGDGGHPRLGQSCQVAEQRAAGDEHLLLGRQIGTTGLDQTDHRQPVAQRDVVDPQDLAQGPRIAGATLDRRVVGHHQALDALDHPDAGDHRGPDLEVRPPGRQGAQLQEG